MATKHAFHDNYQTFDDEADEARLERWARLKYELLILGETGTGKTRLARRIHELSGRPGECVTCSLAELTDELANDELFGHVKFAFTDAKRDRAGAFETAQKGTVILEEVGKSTLRLQGKLLRVVEEKKVTRMGEQRERPVDFRLIVVSNLDLDKLVESGDFLEDLRARFGYYVVYLTPLRERRHLILTLAAGFLETECAMLGTRTPPSLGTGVEKILQSAPWPKNIRELRDVCRYLVGNAGDVAGVRDLPPAFLHTLGINAAALGESIGERAGRVLEQVGGNKSKAARQLRMSRGRLYRVLGAKGQEGHQEDALAPPI